MFKNIQDVRNIAKFFKNIHKNTDELKRVAKVIAKWHDKNYDKLSKSQKEHFNNMARVNMCNSVFYSDKMIKPEELEKKNEIIT